MPNGVAWRVNQIEGTIAEEVECSEFTSLQVGSAEIDFT